MFLNVYVLKNAEDGTHVHPDELMNLIVYCYVCVVCGTETCKSIKITILE